MAGEYHSDMCSHLSDFFVIWSVIFFDLMLLQSEIELIENVKRNLQVYFYFNNKKKVSVFR